MYAIATPPHVQVGADCWLLIRFDVRTLKMDFCFSSHCRFMSWSSNLWENRLERGSDTYSINFICNTRIKRSMNKNHNFPYFLCLFSIRRGPARDNADLLLWFLYFWHFDVGCAVRAKRLTFLKSAIWISFHSAKKDNGLNRRRALHTCDMPIERRCKWMKNYNFDAAITCYLTKEQQRKIGWTETWCWNRGKMTRVTYFM